MFRLLKQILLTGIRTEAPPNADDSLRVAPPRVSEAALRRIGRAPAIRHVDAGSCNGCELEIQMLNNCYHNAEGVGIGFTSSPRHADMLLVTGPVSRNMKTALELVHEALPEPKLVVAVGECACTGGIFGEGYASCGRVSNVIPVDVQVPGCPPAPPAILQAILTAVAVPKADP